MRLELRIVEMGDYCLGNVVIDEVNGVNDLRVDDVDSAVREAVSKGCCRVNIVVVTDLSPGEVLGALRPVIKAHVYPSMSVWVVRGLSEAMEALSGEAVIYG